VQCITGNGHGGSSSGDTQIRNFSTCSNTGTAINRTARTTTTADYFDILEDGVYCYRYADRKTISGSVNAGISINTTATSTAIQSISQSERLEYLYHVGADGMFNISGCKVLPAGSRVRAHNGANLPDDTSPGYAQFTITKVAN
jgi:hypothetical protein